MSGAEFGVVRLSKIYTKTGDGGQTMLGDGQTVPKHDARVEAYGTIDEANAIIGLAVLELVDDHDVDGAVAEELARVQHDLFDAGADLCVPVTPDERPEERLRITSSQVERLEQVIDRLNEGLTPLNSFVVPGGTKAATLLHAARTVVRRAERRACEVADAEPERMNREAVVYLNRLSDLLFVMARACNAAHGGAAGDVLWKPGANR